MNYKQLCLNILLVPFTILSNNNVDVRVQELKKVKFEKELGLTEMSKRIMANKISSDASL